MNRFGKVLLFLFVGNTVLFTLIKIYGGSIAWLIFAEVVLFVIAVLIKAQFSNPARLQKEAIAMGWVFVTTQRDPESGLKDVIFERDGLLARVSWSNETIGIVGSGAEFKSLRKLEESLICSGAG